jgi:ATP-binding cassette subfamily B protein
VRVDTTLTIAEEAPQLSRSPWRFALIFYLKARLRLLAIFVFEAAQAACTILLPREHPLMEWSRELCF